MKLKKAYKFLTYKTHYCHIENILRAKNKMLQEKPVICITPACFAYFMRHLCKK